MTLPEPGAFAPELDDLDGQEVAPAVVAVVVTHDSGEWLEESLTALREQTYPNLSVLVVDAASTDDPTARIAGVLPSAYVRRLDANPGFGAAANNVIDLVEGAAFFCFCHDDAAPDADAIRLMVEESFRSNAGVVGPKLVDWDDPSRLLQVGLAADKTGVVVPYAEHGELDQEQHDAVRDVFAVPGGCMLVAPADLFAHIGGFDPAIEMYGEDLDLCWRSHAAGARVMVAPQARVRHRESSLHASSPDDVAAATQRHRVRTMLSCYTAATLMRVVPQAAVLSLLEILYQLFNGRLQAARRVTRSWSSNLRRIGGIRARRRQIAAVRTVPDSDVRHLQVRGSARLSAFMRGQVGAGHDQLATMTRREIVAAFQPGPRRSAVIAVAAVAVVLVIGSRQLLFGYLPTVGEFARFPSAGGLLGGWLSGWRDIGLGAAAPAPTATGLLGMAGYVFLGAVGVLRKVVILGLLPLGAWGAWRLARPIGSRRARIVALLVYVAIPVPYNAIAQGRWSGLVMYAAAPWILVCLARGSGAAPFGRGGLPAGSSEAAAAPPTRPVIHQVLRLGLVVGLAGMVVPFVIIVVPLMAIGLAVGGLVCGRARGVGRMLLVAVGGVVVGAVLQLPWALGFFHHDAEWTAFAGARSGLGGWLSVGHLLRFESGPFGAAPLGWAFLVVAALPLLIARGWRLEWAARGWFVALASWALLWAGQEDWLHLALPPAEVLLAPAAAGLALAAALGVAAFEVDLPSYRFGWRQGVTIVAGAALVVGALPMLGGAAGGRWRMPGGDFNSTLGFIQTARDQQPFRVLWAGDPEALPLASWRLDDATSYGTTNQGLPNTENLWTTAAPGNSKLLAEALQAASDGRTNHLGALLAPMGVRYLVVPDQIVPAPYHTSSHPAPKALKAGLAGQLDLRPETGLNPAVTVYTNTAWQPLPRLLPADTVTGTGYTAGANLALSRGLPVLTDPAGSTDASGVVPRAGDVFVDQSSAPGWGLQVNGRGSRRSTAMGWANSFSVPEGGRAHLAYHTPSVVRALLLLQVLLWLLALFAWREIHRRELEKPEPKQRTEPAPPDREKVLVS